MTLAHGAAGGGPSIELLLLAAGLLVLGVVFFVQKSTKTSVAVLLILGAFVVGAGSFAFGGDEHVDATIEIVAPEDGATVPAGEPVTIEVAVEGAKLTAETHSEDPDLAHYHVHVDGELQSMPATPVTEVELEPGEHTIAVELTTATHQSFDPAITDEITVRAR